MNFFSIIPEGQGIIFSRGVYRQAKLYERAGKIHAQLGQGYVRLNQGGATSSPNVRWSELDTPEGSYAEVGGFVEYVAGGL